MAEPPIDASDKFEKALEEAKHARHLLRLYVAGNTPASARAIMNIREICETHLKGRYQLEVIDIYQQPELARHYQIIAVPALIKSLPSPIRLLIGDLSETEKVLVGLNLRPREAES